LNQEIGVYRQTVSSMTIEPRSAGFWQDSWTVSSRAERARFGARYDYDSFTGDINVAPRGVVHGCGVR